MFSGLILNTILGKDCTDPVCMNATALRSEELSVQIYIQYKITITAKVCYFCMYVCSCIYLFSGLKLSILFESLGSVRFCCCC